MLMISKDPSNTVYYFDMETGKVVSELKHHLRAAIKDISLTSRLAYKDQNPTFYACQNQNLILFDPRNPRVVASERPYATNYGFRKIAAGGDGHYAVASENGDIRLYSHVGGNAKNVIPSISRGQIVSLESSTDRQFILAATSDNIILLPTMVGNRSGFGTMFRIGGKPRPMLLKVDAGSLAELGLSQPNFKYAKFDEKRDEPESFIVAASNNFLVIWSIQKIMRGNLISRTIKQFGDVVVANEFKFDSNLLVAALPKNVIVQETMSFQ